MSTYFIFVILIFLLSVLVQFRFKDKISKYSEMPLGSGLSGKEVAEAMLLDHNIYNVMVTSSEGELSDHYNPSLRSVNLSQEVYFGRSLASAAIAAHECGHAVQHAQAFHWLRFRTDLVPVISISSSLLQWVLLSGIILMSFTGSPVVLGIGVVCLALITLFSLITLPVEFDASKRALAWLNKDIAAMQGTNISGAKDALWWAAMTYVVAALGSVGNLLYYAGMIFGRGER